MQSHRTRPISHHHARSGHMPAMIGTFALTKQRRGRSNRARPPPPPRPPPPRLGSESSESTTFSSDEETPDEVVADEIRGVESQVDKVTDRLRELVNAYQLNPKESSAPSIDDGIVTPSEQSLIDRAQRDEATLRAALKQTKVNEMILKNRMEELKADLDELATDTGAGELVKELRRAREERDEARATVTRLNAQLEQAGITPVGANNWLDKLVSRVCAGKEDAVTTLALREFEEQMDDLKAKVHFAMVRAESTKGKASDNLTRRSRRISRKDLDEAMDAYGLQRQGTRNSMARQGSARAGDDQSQRDLSLQKQVNLINRTKRRASRDATNHPNTCKTSSFPHHSARRGSNSRHNPKLVLSPHALEAAREDAIDEEDEDTGRFLGDYLAEPVFEWPKPGVLLPMLLLMLLPFSAMSLLTHVDEAEDVSLINRMTNDEFLSFQTVFLSLTCTIVGLGSEVVFGINAMRYIAVTEVADAVWRYAQLLFPLFLTVAIYSRSVFGLPFLVLGLWKFGFPEVTGSAFGALFVEEEDSLLRKIIYFLNAVFTLTHHLSATYVVCGFISGQWIFERHVIAVLMPLVVQHWLPMLKYHHRGAYIGLSVLTEIWWEMEAISNMPFVQEELQYAGLIMLCAHWGYMLGGFLGVVDDIWQKFHPQSDYDLNASRDSLLSDKEKLDREKVTAAEAAKKHSVYLWRNVFGAEHAQLQKGVSQSNLNKTSSNAPGSKSMAQLRKRSLAEGDNSYSGTSRPKRAPSFTAEQRAQSRQALKAQVSDVNEKMSQKIYGVQESLNGVKEVMDENIPK